MKAVRPSQQRDPITPLMQHHSPE